MTDMSETTTIRVEGMRAYPQGELFFLTKAKDGFDALVYNTTGRGPCPDEQFAAIDVEALAAEHGCDQVWRNPRRFWMMDVLTIDLVGEPATFGGVPFNLVARMHMPAGFDPGKDQSAFAYHRAKIQRVNVYEFLAGRPVYLLRDPDEVTWVMQTYTNHVAHDLTESDLSGLGNRLDLPAGWEFRTVTLSEDLAITTTGVADIVPDGLANMYQGLINGVGTFDPWR
ncbi:hypothetical protein IWX63_002675 [Arthrobacter sp. CAN_A2]|uniref:hypothetical protein n=1 Tax=Arthrobacter sp. CAN_A2 TaxID=2787718 RepID=UPI0018EFEA91